MSARTRDSFSILRKTPSTFDARRPLSIAKREELSASEGARLPEYWTFVTRLPDTCPPPFASVFAFAIGHQKPSVGARRQQTHEKLGCHIHEPLISSRDLQNVLPNHPIFADTERKMINVSDTADSFGSQEASMKRCGFGGGPGGIHSGLISTEIIAGAKPWVVMHSDDMGWQVSRGVRSMGLSRFSGPCGCFERG